MAAIRTLTIGEFVIEARASDNFVNATQMCKAGGKQFKDWDRLDSTKNLVRILIKNLNNHHESNRHTRLLNDDLYSTVIDKKVGGNHSGSWIHPDLAVQLAQWVSAEVAIQVSRWVRELTTTGSVSINGPVRTDEELKEMERRVFDAETALAKREQLLADKDAKIKAMEARMLKAAVLADIVEELPKNEYIYIATTDQYAATSRFKVGGTGDFKKRLVSYNSSHTKADPFYYVYIARCNNYHLIEATMKQLLRPYLDKKDSTKEMYNVHYPDLLFILDSTVRANNMLVNYVNGIRQDLFDRTIGEPVITPLQVTSAVEPVCVMLPAVPEFKRDELLDKVFTSPEDTKIYISKEIIDYCGYTHTDINCRKSSFNRLLKRNESFKEGKDFWRYDNRGYEKEYPRFCGDPAFPHPRVFKAHGMSKCEHIIATTNCLGQLLLSTQNGSYNRQYCMRMARG